MNREANFNWFGDGIAMPPQQNEAVKEATVLFAKSNKGVDYASLINRPVLHDRRLEGANDTHWQPSVQVL